MGKNEHPRMFDSMIDLTEIRTNFREIAEDMDPNSESMRRVREIREEADKRIAESGHKVIL